MTDIEKKLNEYQMFTKQLELVVSQKAQLMTRQEELKIALEDLKALPKGAAVFKLLGGFMVQMNKDDAEKKINEDSKEIGMRVETVEKQEKRITEKLKDMRADIESLVGKQQAQGTD